MARRRKAWLLLTFVCVLWIYHGIDQRWTRNFDSSGTTPDCAEETFTVPTGNETSIGDSYPTTFDDAFDSPPSRTIAAVLPVTSSSLPHLSDSLSELSTIPYLGEIHLLCQENVTSVVRNVLRQTLARAQGSGHTVFFVTLWHDGRSETESALQVASKINPDCIFILPQDALAGTDSVSRTLLLRGPPSLSVPLGLRGAEVSCETKYQGFLVASFVLPPLFLPSRLATTNQSYFHLTSWQELGTHFTQFEGVGGVVASETPGSTSRCYHPDPPLHLEHPHPLPDSLKLNDFLVILAAGSGDIPALLKLACKFRSRGGEVKLIAYAAASDPAKPPETAIEGCDVACTHVHDLQDPTLYQLLDRSLGVFLTLTEYHLPPESPLEANTRATVIRIPRRDLPHCDWIASLELWELRNWYVPRVDLSVITNDRPNSLRRLLQSLSNSRYFGDKLNIRINIEQDADYETLELVDNWNWEYGSVFINRRVIHAGLLPAVVESWYPHSSHSYGLILEDDVEVSPLFYGWLKMNLLRYRYGGNQNLSTHMFGISLYQQKVVETRQEGRVFFNPRTVFAANDIIEYTTPYLSQIPCSWGAVYFPEHWREFHSYLNVRLSEALFGIDAVVVPNARSNRWSKSWKKYFIELAYLRGYVMVYPNYDNFVSFSTNHLEIGSHVKEAPWEVYAQKREKFRVPLMELEGTTRLMDLPHGTLPSFDDLPVLDLFGRLSSLETLILLGQTRRTEMFPACELSSEDRLRPDFRGLLCVHSTE